MIIRLVIRMIGGIGMGNKTNHPPKPADRKKSESIKIMMTPAERAMLEANAADMGIRMSELLLELLRKQDAKRQRRLKKESRGDREDPQITGQMSFDDYEKEV